MAVSPNALDRYVTGDNFELYAERVSAHFISRQIPEDMKVPHFLTLVGPKYFKILKSLVGPDEFYSKSFSELVEVLQAYISRKVNKRAERFKFSNAKQHEDEQLRDFIVRLKEMAETCSFGNGLDDALTDQFITGIRSDAIRNKLLEVEQNEDLNFEKCSNIAFKMEMYEEIWSTIWLRNSIPRSAVLRNSFQEPTEGYNPWINAYNDDPNRPISPYYNPGNPFEPQQQDPWHNEPLLQREISRVEALRCLSCGVYYNNCFTHGESDCPAIVLKWACYTCKKTGHVASVCELHQNVAAQ